MTVYMKKIESNCYVHTKVDICAKFQLSRLIFIFINCFQLSSTIDSCWHLMTADMKKSLSGIFIYTLELVLVPNFSSLAWFLFSLLVNSCCQLLTAFDSWWQLIWKKIYCNFYVHTKVGTCAEFQFSSLIFIFISCQQLLSAVDSCW